MLLPIARILSNKRKIGYIVYDTVTNKADTYTNAQIGEKGVCGINPNVSGTRLYTMFENIGSVGSEQQQSWTVVEKIIYKNETKIKIVNIVGESKIITKDELINLIKSGEKVAGCRLINNQLQFSSVLDVKVDESYQEI